MQETFARPLNLNRHWDSRSLQERVVRLTMNAQLKQALGLQVYTITVCETDRERSS